MSQITIQCRLLASESTRQQLWQLMAEKNTPLINELLMQMGKHPEFETWRQKGKHPTGVVKELCEPLKTDPRFMGQPARFYTSATASVNYIYKSWFALMKRFQSQLDGKLRWLEMLNSDTELVAASGVSLDTLQTKSAEILAQFAAQNPAETQPAKGKKGKKSPTSDSERNLSKNLFDAYSNTEDNLTRCAISYLLKNGCKISNKAENTDKFAQRRRKVEIQIQRLTEKLAARIPKGRDLTDTLRLETLFNATQTVPENETEAKLWQNILLRKSSQVPFPVAYETNEDLVWFKNQFGRICVKFSGLSEHTFQIYCDSRQLHWFQRFLEDQQIKKDSKNQHSSALFTLRSGRISWQEGQGKGEPWNIHHLTLYCSVDTRLWTEEGTNLVKEEKAEEIAKTITQTKAKGDLNDKQQAHLKRKNSSLARINNPFPRPSQPLYKGLSHILVGVSLGLENPATIAVVDGTTGKVLTYRNIKQLLGESYKLLNRQRQQKHLLSHERHVAQRMSAPNQFGDSELGEYIDRLLAKEIIAVAQTYKAGSIVIPKLGDMREQVQSEIQSKAEQKSDIIEVQQKYAKQYRTTVHQWSYGRLIANIQSQANKAGIAIEEGKQPIRASPLEKAKELAISAYQSRKA
ncbi:type V CRISPR-associated protein Cas12k [Cuspidothrix issatschenkoi LEGE 03284]|uniref:type V CRISPR-associated protein Cas12k n=1 Tax=Cuspidothrix issatschenkoi TaxID=230752 RepID=UPI0018820CF8|nr:type V CRISPR-associated protein Cas12k [Cuspidothrix issatschenkoi]MBE9230446.1 type V CRISPR-associated protein Cas12k [Cuspidothrix issatschenkoi LEGE 03284]